MHRVAENGFAAHWLYKSSSDSPHSPGENNPGKDLSHPRKKKNPEMHANESLPDSVKKIENIERVGKKPYFVSRSCTVCG